jgi:hypothetical protein
MHAASWMLILFAYTAMAHAIDNQNQVLLADRDVPPHTSANQPLEDESGEVEVTWELDPYYTDVGLNIPLTGKPVPTITSDSELDIYRHLIEGSAIPRYMLLEASVYPMPALGTYLKSRQRGLYDQGQIGNSSINLFESVTAGFQEPWAASVFFGNIAKLERTGEKRHGSNMGYSGYLLSGGSKHIKNNALIDDDWYELEWKIKGKRDYAGEKMSWSFRAGAKFNGNPNITDVVYFSIHRTNLDVRAPFLSWIKNSSLDLKIQFSQHGGQVVRQELIVGKKYPVSGKDYTTTLDVGVVWDAPDEYSGLLRDRTTSKLTLLIRPSIEF